MTPVEEPRYRCSSLNEEDKAFSTQDAEDYVLIDKEIIVFSMSEDGVRKTGKRHINLNNAGQALISRQVQDVGIQCILNQMPSADRAQETIRELYAKLITAKSAEISIMPCTSAAITFAAMNIERTWKGKEEKISTDKHGARILIQEDQMNSAVYPLQDICDRSQGCLKLDIIPYPKENECWTDLILKKLDDYSSDPENQTPFAAVCLPPLHWADGTAVDLVPIGQICRKLNIPLIVDATQAVGAMPLSVADIQPTILASSIHKWLRGPSGASLVYISPAVQELWQPLDQHGRCRDHAADGGDQYWDAAKDEMGPNGYPEKFVKDARKFDGGGKPHPIVLPMLAKSLEEVVNLDKRQVQQQLKKLMTPLIEWVNSEPDIFEPIKSSEGKFYYHLIGVRPKACVVDTQKLIDISISLKEKYAIYTAARCGALRISPYIDNTEADVHELISAMKELFNVTTCK